MTRYRIEMRDDDWNWSVMHTDESCEHPYEFDNLADAEAYVDNSYEGTSHKGWLELGLDPEDGDIFRIVSIKV
jgi:hypothetical protein